MNDTLSAHAGGCMCGAVRYKLRGNPDWSSHCHCRSCQKATGAAFTTWVGVTTENFELERGSVAICETSPGVARGFCSQCGTSLTYAAEAGWPGQIAVLAPTLDDPSVAAPRAHVYVEHQQPWIHLSDGLPTSKRF